MALIQALLAALSRSLGKILNTAFSWATVALFGKVPQDRQIYLSGMAFGSVAWIVALLGVLFPAFSTFLLTFVPLPKWVDRTWIRLAMLAIALLLPLAIGALSLKMVDPRDAPKDAGSKWRAVIKGYPYTLGLAITLIMLVFFAPVLKLRTLARRWATVHVPVVVEPRDYPGVVDEVQEALKQAGWKTERRPASWMVRFPTRVLTMFAGGAVKSVVADQLTTLVSPKAEVLLHPSDMVISAEESAAAHIRATLAEALAFSKAYLTWTKEANELEDRLRCIHEQVCGRAGAPSPQADGARPDAPSPQEALARIHEIDEAIRTQKIPYEEWESLDREKLLVEREILQQAAGMEVGEGCNRARECLKNGIS